MVEATMGNRGSTETEVIDGVTNSKRIDLDVSARDENTDVSTSAQAAKSSSDLASEAPPKTIQLSEYPEAETATVSVASDEAPSKRKRRAVDRGMYVVQETVKKTRTQKPKKKKQVDTEAEFETAWICVECKEAECMMQPEATELLVCDGLCRRLFHYPCAGLERLPTEDEAFMCEDCKKRIHQCAICSNYGMDEEDVFKCSKDDCGLFFHESCLAMQNVEIEIVEDNVVSSTKKGLDDTEHGDTSSASTSRYFVCPAHNCWTCTQIELKEREKETDNDGANKSSTKKKKNVRGKKKARLPGAFESKNERFMTVRTIYCPDSSFVCGVENLEMNSFILVFYWQRCLECPISYHISCIPPSARFHELATLCHEHSGTSRLPELDPGASIQDQIEKAIDQKFDDFVDRRKRQALADRSGGKNVFFPGMSGDRLTKRESQLLKTIQEEDVSGDQGPTMDSLSFCLPCDIKDEVHSKPPNYRHVHALKYDTNNKPPRVPVSADVCQCVGQCGDDCINRMLYTECFGGATSSTNGSKKACNCNVGPNCGNRQLGQRKAAKCVTKREQGKGWGLVTVNKANKGDLIQEYIGEVIDTKTKEQRLTEWTEKHPNDPNFYIMALQPGWFIDARGK